MPARDMAERQRGSLGDVGLAPVCCAERHRHRVVEQNPARRARVRPGGRARGSPVRAVTFQSMSRTSSSPARMSAPGRARCPAEHVRAVVTREQTFHAANDTARAHGEAGRAGPGRASPAYAPDPQVVPLIGRFPAYERVEGGGNREVPPRERAGGQRRSCHALPPQVELGHGDGGDDLVEQRIGTALLCQRLVREHEPVAEGVLDELLDVADERQSRPRRVAGAPSRPASRRSGHAAGAEGDSWGRPTSPGCRVAVASSTA